MLSPSKIFQLKRLFSTGKTPTGADFAILIEWLSAQLNISQDVFVATKGQTVFKLSGKYATGEYSLGVDVGGVSQYFPTNYDETSDSTITFREGVAAGATVVISYVNLQD